MYTARGTSPFPEIIEATLNSTRSGRGLDFRERRHVAMNVSALLNRVIAVLSRRFDSMPDRCNTGQRGTPVAMPGPGEIALRDSAAFALSCYWTHYYDGWSLLLFRDGSGAIRHVACQTPDRTIVDVLGRGTEEQIAGRLGIAVTASHGEETDVQPLLGPNTGVLVAADELRRRSEHGAAQGETATPAA
jgi:hypothetical protein